MGMEHVIILMVINMKENGRMIREKGRGWVRVVMGPCMMEIGRIIYGMGKDISGLQVETHIKDNG